MQERIQKNCEIGEESEDSHTRFRSQGYTKEIVKASETTTTRGPKPSQGVGWIDASAPERFVEKSEKSLAGRSQWSKVSN